MEDHKNTNNSENSRRKFLQQSVIAGAGLMLAPGLMSASTKNGAIEEINHDKGGEMTTRNLGKLKVSALGAGCMSISANYGATCKN